MLTYNLPDVKICMNKLLASTSFDDLLFISGSVTTYCTFQFDGFLLKDFFNTDELKLLNEDQKHVLWKSIKPHIFNIIKGNKPPLNFKFVFGLPPLKMNDFLTKAGLSLSSSDIEGLYMNIHFNGKELICTTGTSLKVFSLDKTLDHAWDIEVKEIFKQHDIVVS